MNTNNQYYIPNLCMNEDLYIVVGNSIPGLRSQIVLQYIYKSQLYTKESAIFSCNETVELSFLPYSEFIHFFVVGYVGSKRSSIFDISLKSAKTTCFKLHGTILEPKCTEVPC